MQVPSSAQVTPPTVTVNNSVTVSRGFSPEVRSDVPPVQQGEGVRYTRGRPSDNETYSGLYSARKRGAPAEAGESTVSVQGKEPVEAYGDNPEQSKKAVAPEGDSAEVRSAGEYGPAADLSPEDQALVEQLQKRDREVRLHELAHQTAGGQFAGRATYEYQRGPDGKNYAVEGEVSVDVGAADNPEATIQKARQVKAAALAPARPSAQDRQVAREAEQLIAAAQQELRIQAQAETKAERREREASIDDESTETRTAADNGRAGDVPAPVAEKSTKAPVEEKTSVAPPTANETASAEKNDADKSVDKKDKMTAREALEKILLAGQTLSAQAGAAGYVRPDAPAGDSGLLNIVI